MSRHSRRRRRNESSEYEDGKTRYHARHRMDRDSFYDERSQISNLRDNRSSNNFQKNHLSVDLNYCTRRFSPFAEYSFIYPQWSTIPNFVIKNQCLPDFRLYSQMRGNTYLVEYRDCIPLTKNEKSNKVFVDDTINQRVSNTEKLPNELFKNDMDYRIWDDLTEYTEVNVRKDESDGKQSIKKKDIDYRIFDRDSNSQKNDKKCDYCISLIEKHLLVMNNELSCILVSRREPLIENQFFIRSSSHIDSFLHSKQEIFQMMNRFRTDLQDIFNSIEMELIFVEYYFNFDYHNSQNAAKYKKHFEILVYPIKIGKTFDDLKSYFYKNFEKYKGETKEFKKNYILFDNVESLKAKIPKKCSYFSIIFGRNKGFAYILQDEEDFFFFAEVTIGRFFRKDLTRYTNPKKQKLEEQTNKANNLKKILHSLIDEN